MHLIPQVIFIHDACFEMSFTADNYKTQLSPREGKFTKADYSQHKDKKIIFHVKRETEYIITV